MWNLYQRTFLRMQFFIFGLTALVFLATGNPRGSAMLFVVMQLMSLLGARWAERLTRALREKNQALPLRVRG